MTQNFPWLYRILSIPQGNLTLNLLRSAQSNLKLSAHVYLFGKFNLQATPLVPLGTRAIAHKISNTRTTWAAHVEEELCICPAPKHYRYVSIYFPLTRTMHVVDTVRYVIIIIPFPKATLGEHSRQTSSNIVTILSKSPSRVTPELRYGDKVQNTILELAKNFKNTEDIPNLPSIKSPKAS